MIGVFILYFKATMCQRNVHELLVLCPYSSSNIYPANFGNSLPLCVSSPGNNILAKMGIMTHFIMHFKSNIFKHKLDGFCEF